MCSQRVSVERAVEDTARHKPNKLDVCARYARGLVLCPDRCARYAQ